MEVMGNEPNGSYGLVPQYHLTNASYRHAREG